MQRRPTTPEGLSRPRRLLRSHAWIGAFVVLFAVLAAPASGWAQLLQRNDLKATAETAGTASVAAPVEIDGYVLFEVRAGTEDQARQRAREVAARIEEIAQDSAISPESLRVFDLRDQTNILADKQVVMSVFDADARAAGVTRTALAGAFKARIARAIQDYRTQRTTAVLQKNSYYAGGATLALIAVLVALAWMFRWLNGFLERRYKARMKDVQIQSFHILEAEDLWSALRGAIGTVHVLAVLALLIGTLHYVLGLYPWTRPFGLRFLRLILGPLETIGTATLAALPNLFFILILVLIVRYLLKMTRLFFGAVGVGRVRLAGFEREWAMPTYKIIRLFAIAMAVVVAYPYIPGSGSDAFKGVSIFIGLVLSLGSTSIISNMIAGYTMTYRRAFRIGDRIQVKDAVGDVVEMRLLETHLRSVKNEEIVVPNTVILNNEVVNYSTLAEERGLILHTGVGIGYEVPWRQVESMLLQAAERTPGLLRNPPPFVLKSTLSDFCVQYELNVYADDPASMPQLYSQLHENILDVFNEQGVQIMTPAYVSDPTEPKIAPPDRWSAAPAAAPGSTGKAAATKKSA
jgi:small-conductance mechanosensitive channel